jgi:hypothetical protein
MNSARKIVFSRSLLDASAWNNSVVADEGLRQTITKEKSEAGKDMVICRRQVRLDGHPRGPCR